MTWLRWRGRTKKAKPDRASLEQKLRDIRDKRRSDPPMADEEVTGIIGLAIEQLADATHTSIATRKTVVDRMRRTGLDVAASAPPPKLET